MCWIINHHHEPSTTKFMHASSLIEVFYNQVLFYFIISNRRFMLEDFKPNLIP